MKFPEFARHLLAAALILVAARPGLAGEGNKDDILIGQTIGITGILAEAAAENFKGADAYFDQVNRQGGIHGRKIRMLRLDDAYDPARAVANVEKLIDEHKVLAMFSVAGTDANVRMLPMLERAGVPNVAPLTGASALRKPAHPYVFHTRASYEDEIDKIMQHLAFRGTTEVGVVYLNNGLGREGLAAVERSAARRKLRIVAAAQVEGDASNLDAVVETMAKAKPKTILLATTGTPTVKFIKEFNKTSLGAQHIGISIMSSQRLINALGKDGVGVIVSQVSPFPFSATSSIVMEYQKAMAKAGHKDLSYLSMESYISAKALVEALRRCGPKVTRERLREVLAGMGKVDLGGFEVNLKNGEDVERYVELTVISKEGRFLR